jgi:anti-anti-sigma regulatory factor
MLRIDTQTLNTVATFYCSGSLVWGVETETLRLMTHTRHEQYIRIDLSHVHKIDASGLGLLVELQAWACENHRRLTFVELSDEIWRLVIITKLFAALDISYADVPPLLRDAADLEPNEMIA